MTKPITGVALLSLCRAGAGQAHRPGRPLPPRVARRARSACRAATARSSSSRRAADHVRDALMHMTASAPARRRPASTSATSPRAAIAAPSIRRRPSPTSACCWPRSRCGSSQAALALLVVDRHLRPPRGGHRPASSSATTCRTASSIRSGWSTPGSTSRRRRRTGSPRCIARGADKQTAPARRPATQPTVPPAGAAVGRRRARRHARRLRPLLPDAPRRRRARRRPDPRPPDRRADAHQPPAGRRQLRDFALPGGYGEVGFDGNGFGLTSRSASARPPPEASARPATSCGAAQRRRRSGSTRPRTSSRSS